MDSNTEGTLGFNKYNVEEMAKDPDLSLSWCSKDTNPLMYRVMKGKNPDMNEQQLRVEMLTAYIEMYEKNYSRSKNPYVRIAWNPYLTKEDMKNVAQIYKPVLYLQILSLGVSLVSILLINQREKRRGHDQITFPRKAILYSLIPITSLCMGSCLGYIYCTQNLKRSYLHDKYIKENSEV